MASLKDVAKLANVSLMTVSRALNSPERLKPETLSRVQSAIDAMNYVPDLSAKNTRCSRDSKNHRGVSTGYRHHPLFSGNHTLY